jgi:hypothetical protein
VSKLNPRVWNVWARCNHCKDIVKEYAMSDRFFMPVCPKCGEENNVEAVTARHVYKGIWYKPWTWLDEEWEIKRDKEVMTLE